MALYVCTKECWKFCHHWFVGDLCESDEDAGRHFTRFVDGVFPVSGQRLGVKDGLS